MSITITLPGNSNTVENICTVLQVVIALLNIGAILYIFISDRGRYKREYAVSTKNYWFHNLILEENLKKITDFYDRYLAIITDNKNIENKFDQISELTLRFNREVITIVSVIDRDLGGYFSDSTEKLQDLISLKIEQIGENEIDKLNNDRVQLECTNEIIKAKKEAIKKLYNVDLNSSPYNKNA